MPTPNLQPQRQRHRATACALLLVLVVAALGAVAKADTASAFEVLSWSAPVQIDNQAVPSGTILAGISCPSTSFCAAVDNSGNVLTSTNPTGGASAWTKSNVDAGGGPGKGVFCLSASFCVVVDGGDVVTSTNPTGGSAAWTVATIAPQNENIALAGIACASASLCVAGDSRGNLVASTNPTGGASQWHNVARGGEASYARSIACPSASLCVAADASFGVFRSSIEPATSETWASTEGIDGGTAAVSCPSVSLCVGVGLGRAAVASNPAGGTAAWHTSLVDFGEMTSVSCPSASQCDAVDNVGNVVEMDEPLGETIGSSGHDIDGSTSLTGVSCPSEALCLAVDSKGNLLMGTPFIENDSLPQITGSPVLGSTLDASTGSWWGTPQSYAYQWLRDGSSIVGATNPIYVVTAADQGHQFAVEVTASDLTSSASATSATVSVPAASLSLSGGNQPSTGQSAGGSQAANGPGGSTASSGSPTTASATTAQVRASLALQLVPTVKAATIGALLRNGGVTLPFKALEAGTATIDWFRVPGGAKLARKGMAKAVLVAAGQASFSAAGTSMVRVRLTSVGRKLLKHEKRVRLVAKGAFVGRGGDVVSAVKGLLLNS